MSNSDIRSSRDNSIIILCNTSTFKCSRVKKNVFRDTLKKEIKTGQPPYTMTLQNHKNVNFWGKKVAEIVVKLG